MSLNHFTLFADYFQFFIQDESANGNLSDSWNEEAVSRLLAVAPGTVGVGTVRNMDVPVSIMVLDSAPPLELEKWDHVVDCAILVQGSRIVVAGCTDYLPDAARVEVAPGMYRVRVGYAGLASISEDGLSGNDSYKIQLWQAAAIVPRVLKQRAG